LFRRESIVVAVINATDGSVDTGLGKPLRVSNTDLLGTPVGMVADRAPPSRRRPTATRARWRGAFGPSPNRFSPRQLDNRTRQIQSVGEPHLDHHHLQAHTTGRAPAGRSSGWPSPRRKRLRTSTPCNSDPTRGGSLRQNKTSRRLFEQIFESRRGSRRVMFPIHHARKGAACFWQEVRAPACFFWESESCRNAPKTKWSRCQTL
jgi:hypothetical protein